MSKRFLVMAGGLVIVLTTGCTLKRSIIQTERPAMIVRGGSVVVEIENHADNVVWEGLDREWRPNQRSAPSVTGYAVVIEPQPSHVGIQHCEVTGGKVQVSFWSERHGKKTFTFVRPKQDGVRVPRLDGEIGLDIHQSDGRIILNRQFSVNKAQVKVAGNDPCEFDSSTQQVRIRPLKDQ